MRTYLVAIIVISLFSCKSATKYPYAIRDFHADIQPTLESLASKGILNNNTALEKELTEKLSKNDLKKLSKCDVPLLRAFALESLLELEGYLTAKIDFAFEHLDDTACVAIDMGEFGIYRVLVSDYLLNRFNSKVMDSLLSRKLVLELLQNRPYLRSTYSVIDGLVMRPEYYPLIRKLVVLDKKPALIYEDFEGGDAEKMLLKIAAFQQAADTTLIRIRLEEYLADWGRDSFSYLGMGYLLEILKKYPHPEYAVPRSMLVDLMIRYSIGMDEDDPYDKYSGYDISINSYFAAIAAQRNNHSKQQLEQLLQHYQKLGSEEASRLQRFGKETFRKLKSFIESNDYEDYKTLLRKL
ncbi:MAG: hypothetical protein EAY75_11345 [Bacteroidetes bacterium]|nr:MAG: hypothetical protein EAY75_11345 [Bacteroidota bacterium]